MKRKEQYADEIIEMLERTKGGAWVSNINLNTKDRVIEVCQNVVDSWSGRKFKDHCTTSPQALEPKTGRWIPVSERLPENHKDVLICLPSDEICIGCYNSHKLPFSNNAIGWGASYVHNWCSNDVIAWMPLPLPYKAESEDKE